MQEKQLPGQAFFKQNFQRDKFIASLNTYTPLDSLTDSQLILIAINQKMTGLSYLQILPSFKLFALYKTQPLSKPTGFLGWGDHIEKQCQYINSQDISKLTDQPSLKKTTFTNKEKSEILFKFSEKIGQLKTQEAYYLQILRMASILIPDAMNQGFSGGIQRIKTRLAAEEKQEPTLSQNTHHKKTITGISNTLEVTHTIQKKKRLSTRDDRPINIETLQQNHALMARQHQLFETIRKEKKKRNHQRTRKKVVFKKLCR